MWTTPEKHTMRETLRNANQNKTTRRTGYKKVYAPHTLHPKRKHAELKEPYEMLNKRKTLTTIATNVEEGQSKSPKMNQSNWKGALQKPL